MKVILKQEVDNLGLAGDVVDVADGYGRNFLLPRGMAIVATRGAMREAEALTRARKAVEAKTIDSAQASKEAIENRVLQVKARVDERGHLYGSVGVGDIHRVLRERGHQIEKKRIDLRSSIKEIGTYEVPIQVHPQVEAIATVEVLDEEGLVIAGQIAEPEAPPPLIGEEQPADEAELVDAAAEQNQEAEPQIDSVEDLVSQALEAAEEYETEQADEAESGSDAAEATSTEDEAAEA